MKALGLSLYRPIPFKPQPSGTYAPTTSSLTLFHPPPTVRFRPLRCSATLSSSVDHWSKFNEAARHGGNPIPLYRSIPFGDHTPETAYCQWVKEDERDAPSFLFESVEPGLQQGRFSVVGAQPRLEIMAYENMVTVINHREGHRTEEFVEDPMVAPQRIMGKLNPQRLDELPEAFCGGWAGYFSYDTVRYVEKMLPFSRTPKDDRNLPDIHLGLYDLVIVFDHPEKRSTMTSEEYKEAVLKAKKHILAGDIFQIVLSQRFELQTFAHPLQVYGAVKAVNPSPYMAYLQAKGCILVASSPEILTRVRKVSKPGTVCVDKLRDIERHSHVMHISSTVNGELLDHLTSLDALRAAHPVGTVTGAPKMKAMELIDQLEVTRRGPYSGAIGSISFSGDMEMAIALRTVVFPTKRCHGKKQQREWVAHLQAGAGIVADSDPDDEQIECLNKIEALDYSIKNL